MSLYGFMGFSNLEDSQKRIVASCPFCGRPVSDNGKDWKCQDCQARGSK